jgi:hypothetical protein
MGTELFLLNQQKQGILTQAQAHAERYQREMSTVNAKANQERLVHAAAEVKKVIKDFDGQIGSRLKDYAVNMGYEPIALEYMNASAPAVITLWKAMEYDRIQAETKVSLKKVEALPPVAKPSAKGQTSESKSREDKLREQFRKSGGKDDGLSRAILRERLGLGEK